MYDNPPPPPPPPPPILTHYMHTTDDFPFRCLFELAKYRPCLAECKQVLEYYPDDPVVNLLKGQCFISLGNNIDAAIRAFERGLCSCPGNASLSEALNSAIKQKHSKCFVYLGNDQTFESETMSVFLIRET